MNWHFLHSQNGMACTYSGANNTNSADAFDLFTLPPSKPNYFHTHDSHLSLAQPEFAVIHNGTHRGCQMDFTFVLASKREYCMPSYCSIFLVS